METDLQQAGLFKQRFEGPFGEVLRVERCADVAGEDQASILVQPQEPHPLLELALTVRLECGHRPGREIVQRAGYILILPYRLQERPTGY